MGEEEEMSFAEQSFDSFGGDDGDDLLVSPTVNRKNESDDIDADAEDDTGYQSFVSTMHSDLGIDQRDNTNNNENYNDSLLLETSILDDSYTGWGGEQPLIKVQL